MNAQRLFRFRWPIIFTAFGMFFALIAFDLYWRGLPENWFAWLQFATLRLMMFAVLIVGAVTVSRIRASIYGWQWIAMSFGFGVVQPLGSALVLYGTSHAVPLDPVIGLGLIFAVTGWLIAIASLALALLMFPTGSVPSIRWTRVTQLILASTAVSILSGWAVPGMSGMAPVENPFGLPGLLGATALVVFFSGTGLLLLVGFPLAVISLFVRYRREGGVQRAQIRWLAFAGGINVIFLIVDGTDIHDPFVSEAWMGIFGNLGLLLLPIAVLIAVLRYRLYDIDFVIRRTLQYSLLTGLLALVYFGLVIVSQNLLGVLGLPASSNLITVVTTLGVAALINPMRSRLQRFIDKRFFRAKYDAELVLTSFSSAVRDQVDLENLTDAILEVVNSTVKPLRISLWMDTGRRR